jgi:hypothetical protein
MKKFVIILIMIAGSFFVGCFGGDDEFESAQLKYRNSQDSINSISQIRWVTNAVPNQEWDETLTTTGDETVYKEVTTETGISDAVDDDSGDTIILEYCESGACQALTLSDGSSNTFVIYGTVKK